MTLVDGKLSPQPQAVPGRRHPLDAAAKRLLDVVASSLMLIAATPFMLLAVAGIGLSSPGPVFYRARRVGKDGQLFSMLKFRSMRINSDALSPITAPGDSRIFPFGHFLRVTKIDELPQLWNVLVGDMSLVGPRPEDPTIVETYYDERMRLSLTVRPGLTSPGTILYMKRFRDTVSTGDTMQSYVAGILREKLETDVAYLAKATVFRDVWLLVQTAGLIVSKFVRSPGRE